MKIAFVLDTFGGGGKERRCLQIIQGLNNVGINNIQVIVIDNKVAYEEIYNTTAKIIILDRLGLGLSKRSIYSRIKSHLKSFEPDIVQGWGWMSLFYLNLIRLSLRFKYVASHVADANVPTGIYKLTNIGSNLLCDAVIGNSKAGLKAYSVPKQKAFCFYNGFNPDRLKKIQDLDVESLRASIDVKTPYLVTMVARVDNYKDYDCFVDVARTITSKRRDVTFLALGKGDLLEKFLMETKKDERIKFLGFRSDIEQILSISTVSLLCSNYKVHGEGISNTILESMALGIPVVATKCGGTPEIIKDGKNGFCVENNNREDFYDKINQLLDDDKLRQDFSIEAINTVDSNFSLEKSMNEYIQFYKQLLK